MKIVKMNTIIEKWTIMKKRFAKRRKSQLCKQCYRRRNLEWTVYHKR